MQAVDMRAVSVAEGGEFHCSRGERDRTRSLPQCRHDGALPGRRPVDGRAAAVFNAAMQLLDHVSITVRDLDAARPFYRAIFAALGAVECYDEADAIGFGERNAAGSGTHSYLSVFRSPDAMPDARRHWCFKASSVAAVRAFHRAGLAHGGTDGGAPGLRDYHPGYYAAFLFDPEGNKVEAVHHAHPLP